MRTEMKICGIRTASDIELAINSGAKYVGLIFVKSSPRYIEPKLAQQIIATVHKKIQSDKAVQIVGVFQNQSKTEIEEIASLVNIDLFQLHGIESPVFCGGLSKPVIKAFQISDKALIKESCRTLYATDSKLETSGNNWLNVLDEYRSSCKHFLFDRPKESPDPHWLDYGRKELAAIENKLGNYFLGGGLDSSNIKETLRILCPAVVDLCSGVENKERKKNKEMIEKFVSEFQSKNIGSNMVNNLVSNEVVYD